MSVSEEGSVFAGALSSGASILSLYSRYAQIHPLLLQQETAETAPAPLPLHAAAAAAEGEAAAAQADAQASASSSTRQNIQQQQQQQQQCASCYVYAPQAVVEQVTCPICLEVLSRPVLSPCGHLGCGVCMFLAVRSRGRCPLCNFAMDSTLQLQRFPSKAIVTQLLKMQRAADMQQQQQEREPQEPLEEQDREQQQAAEQQQPPGPQQQQKQNQQQQQEQQQFQQQFQQQQPPGEEQQQQRGRHQEEQLDAQLQRCRPFCFSPALTADGERLLQRILDSQQQLQQQKLQQQQPPGEEQQGQQEQQMQQQQQEDEEFLQEFYERFYNVDFHGFCSAANVSSSGDSASAATAAAAAEAAAREREASSQWLPSLWSRRAFGLGLLQRAAAYSRLLVRCSACGDVVSIQQLSEHQQLCCSFSYCRFRGFGCPFALHKRDRELLLQLEELQRSRLSSKRVVVLLQRSSTTQQQQQQRQQQQQQQQEQQEQQEQQQQERGVVRVVLEELPLEESENELFAHRVKQLKEEIRSAARQHTRLLRDHERTCSRRLVKCACCLQYITLQQACFLQEWTTGHPQQQQQQQEQQEVTASVALRSDAGPVNTTAETRTRIESSEASASAAAAAAAADEAGAAARGRSRVRYFPLMEVTAGSCLFASPTSDFSADLQPDVATDMFAPFEPALSSIAETERAVEDRVDSMGYDVATFEIEGRVPVCSKKCVVLEPQRLRTELHEALLLLGATWSLGFPICFLLGIVFSQTSQCLLERMQILFPTATAFVGGFCSGFFRLPLHLLSVVRE